MSTTPKNRCENCKDHKKGCRPYCNSWQPEPVSEPEITSYRCRNCERNLEDKDVFACDDCEPQPEPKHREQVYQCQDCSHTMSERELGSSWDDGEFVLYCKSCGSQKIRLQR